MADAVAKARAECAISAFLCPIAECEKVEEHDDLGIGNVGGVFIMLAGGCFIAFIIALMEFLWNVEKIAIEEKVNADDSHVSRKIYRLFMTSLSDFAVGCIQIGACLRVHHLGRYEARSIEIHGDSQS